MRLVVSEKEWQTEIKRMLSSGLKYELDALANKNFQCLTKSYLPGKLKEKDWLDWAAVHSDLCGLRPYHQINVALQELKQRDELIQ